MTPHTNSKLSAIISNLFIFLFVYTAFSKLLAFEAFKFTLSKSPLIESKAPIFAWALPAIELIAAGLLFMNRTRNAGAYFSLLLMGVFTAYVLYMLLFTPELPCSCGGVIRSLSWRGHLVLNIVLTGLAFLNTKLAGKHLKPMNFIITQPA